MRPFLRPAAIADIDEAYRWCERQHPGSGDEFLAAVQSTLDHLVTHPMMYPIVHRDVRRALVRRFPYGTFSRIKNEFIVVVACMHGRRDPSRGKLRI
jgi:plasmid stabilization system protein ParE